TYFTYDTKLSRGSWDKDTVLDDQTLADWVQELKKNDVTVVFLRECCFNGEGYSQELQQTKFARELPKPVAVGSIEVSAWNLGQGARSIKHDSTEVGLFTDSLASVLMSDRLRLTFDELATEVEATVIRAERGQEPERFGDLASFKNTVLIDRTLMTLVIQAR